MTPPNRSSRRMTQALLHVLMLTPAALWQHNHNAFIVSALATNKRARRRPARQKSDPRPNLPLTCYAHESATTAGIGINIAETRSKGLGVFATKRILEGDFVGEYEGELLTAHQVEARYWSLRNKKPADRRWIKSRKQRRMGLTGDYLFELGSDVFLDGEDADVSGWCRFMNHAKEGKQACNVETKCQRPMEDYWDTCKRQQRDQPLESQTDRPKLWFVALRDIDEGEELSYDYGDSYWD